MLVASLRETIYRFREDTTEALASAVGSSARVWLLVWALTYLPVLALHTIWKRITGNNIINPHACLLRHIVIRNVDGVFRCRRKTGDFVTVAVHTEEELRPYWHEVSGAFVDVGANVGKYTIAIGRQLGRNGRVVAIEAHPGNFAALMANVSINGLDNVVGVNAACVQHDGSATLFPHRYAPGLHTISRAVYRTGSFLDKLTIPGRSLDSILESAGISEVSLLKIDVEGAETGVLKGAQNLLRSSKHLRILVEAWTNEPLDLLRGEGYEVQPISGRDYVAFKLEGGVDRSSIAS